MFRHFEGDRSPRYIPKKKKSQHRQKIQRQVEHKSMNISRTSLDKRRFRVTETLLFIPYSTKRKKRIPDYRKLPGKNAKERGRDLSAICRIFEYPIKDNNCITCCGHRYPKKRRTMSITIIILRKWHWNKTYAKRQGGVCLPVCSIVCCLYEYMPRCTTHGFAVPWIRFVAKLKADCIFYSAVYFVHPIKREWRKKISCSADRGRWIAAKSSKSARRGKETRALHCYRFTVYEVIIRTQNYE